MDPQGHATGNRTLALALVPKFRSDSQRLTHCCCSAVTSLVSRVSLTLLLASSSHHHSGLSPQLDDVLLGRLSCLSFCFCLLLLTAAPAIVWTELAVTKSKPHFFFVEPFVSTFSFSSATLFCLESSHLKCHQGQMLFHG